MRRISYRPILFCALNAVVMLALTLFWIKLPRTFGDEAVFIKWTSLVKKTVLGIDPKPAAESFLYIDVSHSKALVKTPDPLFEEYTGYNHEAITDRAQVAALLQAIEAYGRDVPLILLDIYFEYPSPDDSLLQAAIDGSSFPVVGARGLGDARTDTLPPAVRLPTGVAMYLSVDENFMKYPLFFNDSLPTLPLVALAAGRNVSYNFDGWWPRLDGRRSLSNPIIDFKVRPFDILDGGIYSLHDLGSLLFQFEFWDEADISALFSGKLIVVGDFYNDTHSTVFGSVPGPMIVHNTYLTLAERETLIYWQWIVFLLALFFWMSWRIYHEERLGTKSWLWARSQTALGKIFADSIDDTFFLAVGTILSYLVFNIHINILVLLIFLKLVAFILRRFVFRKRLLEEEE